MKTRLINLLNPSFPFKYMMKGRLSKHHMFKKFHVCDILVHVMIMIIDHYYSNYDHGLTHVIITIHPIKISWNFLGLWMHFFSLWIWLMGWSSILIYNLLHNYPLVWIPRASINWNHLKLTSLESWKEILLNARRWTQFYEGL